MSSLYKFGRALKRFLPRHDNTHTSHASIFMRENPAYDKYDIGKYTYGSPKVYSWGEGTTLIVGNYCSIADGVRILLGGEHRTDWVTTYPFNILRSRWSEVKGHPRSKGDVIIGNDVWIGHGVIIMSGVTIGDGAVIASGSVVTRNVESYSIVGGNPAKLLRHRFTPEQIRKLCCIKWWLWDDSKMEEEIPKMLTSDVDYFIEMHYNDRK